ncbi:MAG TPA: bifunctional 4-hydroxy-2-oxoglutarate aldolase/2-dehydro-3-deoxy-phosphogluconate aldolase [Hyphomonadaceae bacterium]|jgi:2-dehydro-3-deoxyphosphogluconate aldolase/(4S)-4-hydroxy-2-oxoglutarate aldolase|nr:bifunctional 4-hydroxy-2-oxoglutarate aldolase/2-dehydro-3-deoxy-phosphogluconate aldolase [Hyphomonadaceae bacterium]
MGVMSVDELMAIQPVIPVITVERAEDAAELAAVYVASGLPVIEVTLRTAAALDVIRAMSAVKGAIAGAGTVLSSNDVMLAKEAGAQFIVTPGLSASAVAAAREAGLPILPGIATATELMAGLDLGIDRFKFFPAEQAGGVAMLSAFAGPFGRVKFCPTGGITEKSVMSYLALGNVGCVGGGWLAPKKAVEARDWGAIAELAKVAAALKRS